MKTFYFTGTRTLLLILRAYLCIILSFLISLILGKLTNYSLSPIISTIFLCILFLVFYLSLKKITVVDISIKIHNESIEITKKVLFLKRHIALIKFSDIEKYLLEYTLSHYKFSITAVNKKHRFLIDIDTKNMNEFDNFFQVFESNIIEHNKNNLNIICKELTIYKKKAGLIYGIIVLILFFLIPIFYFIFNLKVKYQFLLPFYLLGLSYLIKLYHARKVDDKPR